MITHNARYLSLIKKKYLIKLYYDEKRDIYFLLLIVTKYKVE